MKMLAMKNERFGWQWVVRRDRNTGGVVTTYCKTHALGAEDLEYFREQFPENEFKVRGEL